MNWLIVFVCVWSLFFSFDKGSVRTFTHSLTQNFECAILSANVPFYGINNHIWVYYKFTIYICSCVFLLGRNLGWIHLKTHVRVSPVFDAPSRRSKSNFFGILDSIRHIKRSYFSVLVTKQVHKESERERNYHKNKHVWILIYKYIFIVYYMYWIKTPADMVSSKVKVSLATTRPSNAVANDHNFSPYPIAKPKLKIYHQSLRQYWQRAFLSLSPSLDEHC